jgi:hypothetical protein
VGGNSRRAIRRAVELGDGWLPFPAPRRLASHVRTASLTSLAELRASIGYAREHAEKIGRSAPLDVCFVPRLGRGERGASPQDPAQPAASIGDTRRRGGALALSRRRVAGPAGARRSRRGSELIARPGVAASPA